LFFERFARLPTPANKRDPRDRPGSASMSADRKGVTGGKIMVNLQPAAGQQINPQSSCAQRSRRKHRNPICAATTGKSVSALNFLLSGAGAASRYSRCASTLPTKSRRLRTPVLSKTDLR
jgi:hypothetical protein